MTYRVRQTEAFARWHAGLRDLRARVAIARRIERITAGTLGDIRSVGAGVSEPRVDIGPGYRVYFVVRRSAEIVLLAGGDKRTQQADIRRARRLAKEV
jgi:putative addiction module killer protein